MSEATVHHYGHFVDVTTYPETLNYWCDDCEVFFNESNMVVKR